MWPSLERQQDKKNILDRSFSLSFCRSFTIKSFQCNYHLFFNFSWACDCHMVFSFYKCVPEIMSGETKGRQMVGCWADTSGWSGSMTFNKSTPTKVPVQRPRYTLYYHPHTCQPDNNEVTGAAPIDWPVIGIGRFSAWSVLTSSSLGCFFLTIGFIKKMDLAVRTCEYQ